MPVIQILTNREYRFELLSQSSQFSTRNIDQKIVWNCWEKIVEKKRKQIWKAISIYDIRVKINMFNMEINKKIDYLDIKNSITTVTYYYYQILKNVYAFRSF